MHDVLLVTWNNQFATLTQHDIAPNKKKKWNIVKLIGTHFYFIIVNIEFFVRNWLYNVGRSINYVYA